MSAAPIIFPSLSRAPKYKSTRKLEDGTIKDSAESGYVSTRPRFTRLRRTFGVTYQNLCAEDVRALDEFESETVQGMAGSFYFPNLLPNGSFEFPPLPLPKPHRYSPPTPPTQAALGWTMNPGSAGDVQMSIGTAMVEDGTSALLFSTVAGSSAPPGAGNFDGAGATVTAAPFPVNAGDTLLFTGYASVSLGTENAAIGVSTQPFFTFDAGAQVYPPALLVVTAGFIVFAAVLTVPAGATKISVGFYTFLNNSSGSAVALNGSLQVLWDNCGLAVTATRQPYGRMPGSSPLVSVVRLTKAISIKDNTWAGGQPTYDATFEVTEV